MRSAPAIAFACFAATGATTAAGQAPADAGRDGASATLGAASAAGAGQTAQRRIRLTVTPRRARVGRRVTFRFRALVRRDPAIAEPMDCRTVAGAAGACADSAGATDLVPVRDALVRFAGRSARTGRRGYARITVRLRRERSYRARASRAGLRPGGTSVRALRSSSSPRFTG